MLNTLTMREKEHQEVISKLDQIFGIRNKAPPEFKKDPPMTPVSQMSINEENDERNQVVCEADINVETCPIVEDDNAITNNENDPPKNEASENDDKVDID